MDQLLCSYEPRYEKTVFCICENKEADQLRGNREADQRLCFRYTDRTIPLLPKSEISSCGCSAWFVSDLVGNPEGRFSHNEAHNALAVSGPEWDVHAVFGPCLPQLLAVCSLAVIPMCCMPCHLESVF